MFTTAFGADGAGAAIAYALGVNAGATGLIDTATGEAVSADPRTAAVVEGRTATTDLLVFTVSVDSAGTVTLDQHRAVVHPDAANPDDPISLAADNLVTLTATVTDGDGDRPRRPPISAGTSSSRTDGPVAAGDVGAIPAGTFGPASGIASSPMPRTMAAATMRGPTAPS